ncbi:MAG TPA: hypothetical protein QF753_03710 [Victivallales bacterium]|nr:hypothetical protein [Victivallales bacterium]
MSKKTKHKKLLSKKKQSVNIAVLYSTLLKTNIPPGVMKKLNAVEGEIGSNNELNKSLEMIAKEITSDFHPDFNEWNKKFQLCFTVTNAENFEEHFNALPLPPEISKKTWSNLLSKSDENGLEGIAASLAIYNLACAKTVRQIKEQFKL